MQTIRRKTSWHRAALNVENRAVKDVVIDIEYCGICHSDIHFARNEWGMTTYPVVPGHEIIGRVRSVGMQSLNSKQATWVGVGVMVDSCHSCQSCDQGLEQYCENGFTATYGWEDHIGGTPHTHTFGGYSDVITVDESFVLNIPGILIPLPQRHCCALELRPIHPCVTGR